MYCILINSLYNLFICHGPKLIRVSNWISVDCCDGSDEYDGSIRCPNTCVMGGNFAYKSDDTTSFSEINKLSTVSDLDNIYAKETKSRMKLDDLIQKLLGILLLNTVLNS